MSGKIKSEAGIYEFKPDLDQRSFECLRLIGVKSLLGREYLTDDFYPKLRTALFSHDWQMEPLSGLWNCLNVRHPKPKQVSDCPTIEGEIPAFSTKACALLSDFLTDSGEILPLKCVNDNSDFFAYKCLSVCRSLREDESDILWSSMDRLNVRKGRTARCYSAEAIRHFVFSEYLDHSAHIFRIPQLVFSLFVTEEFVRTVHDAGLQGFKFRKVFPVERRSTRLP